MANSSVAIENVKKGIEAYEQLAAKDKEAGRGAAMILRLRAARGLEAGLRAGVILGDEAMKSACTVSAAAFTHGFGPQGVTDQEVDKYTRMALGGEMSTTKLIDLAWELAQKQPYLVPEPILLNLPAKRQEFRSLVLDAHVAYLSWVDVQGDESANRPTEAHTIGISNDAVIIDEGSRQRWPTFDTSRGEPLRADLLEEITDRVVGLPVITDDGPKALIGVRFRGDGQGDWGEIEHARRVLGSQRSDGLPLRKLIWQED